MVCARLEYFFNSLYQKAYDSNKSELSIVGVYPGNLPQICQLSCCFLLLKVLFQIHLRHHYTESLEEIKGQYVWSN